MQRTARGVDGDAWQSGQAAVRWTPKEIGNLRSWLGGAAESALMTPPGADEAAESAGTHAMAR